MSSMTTKRPKKTTPKAAAKPKAAAGKKKKPAPVKAAEPEETSELDGEDGDEDEEEEVAKPAPVAAKPKPAPAKRASSAQADPEAPVVVPARRLTPEARAAVNAMVAKGVSLQEALRATAKWETYVAPVREPVPGGPAGGRPEGGPLPRMPRDEEEEPRRTKEEDEEEPADAGDE
jgi:hypothetical protein